MRTLCLLAGMAAIALKLKVGAAFALLGFKWSWLPDTVTVLVALFIAWRLVLKPPVAPRWHGPDWMAWAIGAAAVVSVLLGPDSPWTTLRWRLGFRLSTVLATAADLALVGLFLKLALDTPREEAGEALAEPPKIRLFLATWLVLSFLAVTPAIANLWMTFSPGGALQALADLGSILSGKMFEGSSAWLGVVSWAAAAAAAWYLLAYGRVLERLPADGPGMSMVTWGLMLALVVAVPMLGLGAVQPASNFLMALLAIAVFMGPIAVLGATLLTVGLFRVLFNLEPEFIGAEAGEDEEPATPAGPAAPPVPVAPVAFGRAPAAAPTPAASAPATTVAAAREQLAARPHDAVLHQQLHNLMLAEGAAVAELLAHGRDFIALLVRQSLAERAFTVLKTCLSKDAAFKPHADQVLPLANLAQAHGEPLVALRLMHEFDRHYPNHPAAVGVLYLSARVLRSQNKFAPAARILDQLLQRFPNDPLVPQARSLREALARLAPSPEPTTPKPA